MNHLPLLPGHGKNRRALVVLAAMIFVQAADAAVYVNPDGVNVGDGSGSWSNSVGTRSIAVGKGNLVYDNSAAIGDYNVVMIGNPGSPGSVALGGSNGVYGVIHGVVTGYNNYVSYQSNVFVAGDQNNVYSSSDGVSNMVLGSYNQIYEGDNSVILGNDNQTFDSKAWILGEGNHGQSGTVILGSYANTVTDAALIVGNGDQYNPSNALVVMKDGSVQFGSAQLGGQPVLTPAFGESAGISTGIVAFGAYSNAWGDNSLALGIHTNATGSDSVAIGGYAGASATSSTAIGAGAAASGDYSIALAGGTSGGICSFSSTYGIAGGYGAVAMMGAEASGDLSVAIGGMETFSKNVASGSGATAVGGMGNIASGDVSTATGYYTRAASLASTAIGMMNVGGGTAGDWVQTDPLFEVGNGFDSSWSTSPEHRSNALTMLKNGRTTLANRFWSSSAPTAIPSNATESSNGQALVVEGHTSLKGNTEVGGNVTINGKVTISTVQGDISMGIYE